MDSQIVGQLAIGAVAIVLGLSGWLLPYRWNILRLKRGFARHLPDHVNEAIPKVLGTICIVVGVVVLAGTVIIGRFQ